ncbi:MAG: DNA polymerase III subunit delta' C-terminal domain-containing protein [Verrucomicrobiales bacterium]|jgi:DNA polymerase-3 subunit delta'|nr:DNA polymerase III subunit delta' C-terminal domain-containing protein [Verrucomicrobiales bacterium]
MAFLVDQAYGYLAHSHAEDRLAHAYLITGPEGAGKDALALRLIALTNGIHAETLESIRDESVQLIRPESRSRRITIDQIRELERKLHLSGTAAKTKIGVIRDADRLQEKSENAFLKTLEEPPPRTLLLLLTSQPEQLLDTIRSRCISVALYSPGLYQPNFPKAFQQFIQAIGTTLSDQKRSLSRALVLARTFTAILKEEKEILLQENDAALKAEISRYGETTDGDWLKRRETFFKDRTESEYVQRRTTMLEGLLSFLGDVLRLQAGYQRLDFNDFGELAHAIASQLPPNELNTRFSALEDLRRHLETTVQDALAIEVGFIKAFA